VEARTGPQAPCSLAVPGGFWRCMWMCNRRRPWPCVCVGSAPPETQQTNETAISAIVCPSNRCLVVSRHMSSWRVLEEHVFAGSVPTWYTCLTVSKFTYQVAVDRRTSVTLSGPVPACISLYSPLLHLSQHLHPSETTDFTQTPSGRIVKRPRIGTGLAEAPPPMLA
jgi:hypothetical protein